MPIDLSECEREPICHLGLIQPHGYLLAVDSRGDISHASENIGELFPLNARAALGRSLEQVLGAGAERLRREAEEHAGETHHEIWERDSRPYSLWVHTRGGKQIFEWEPLDAERPSPDASQLATGLGRIREAANPHRQAQAAAELAAQLTGFSRVMIYQFLPDWSGEVIAEARQPLAEPFLGLRYPASDIPPQARQLYTETLLRVLVDVYATPVGILSPAGESVPLDLTASQLRAMSRYHIEYLKNMKVGATATVSLLCEGVLWGLLACHHDRRKVVVPAEKKALAEIAQTVSMGLERAAARGRRLSAERLNRRLRNLESNVTSPALALSAILFGPERLRNLLHGCGTAVWSAAGLLRMGETPTAPEIEAYARRLLSGTEDVTAIDSRAGLAARLGVAPREPSLAGLLAAVVSREPAFLLFAFRPEALREVIWGGDINQPVLRDELTGALSPRRSFAQYKQNIAGMAAPWSEEDRATAQIVLQVLRRQAATPQQMTQLIEAGLAGIRGLATDDHPLHNTLLDALGDGISLVFRAGPGEATLRYANQSLLELAETFSEAGAPWPSTADLLAAFGLPAEVLADGDWTPRQIAIPTPRAGLRHFLVEKKLALEITDAQGTAGLSAVLFTDTTRVERARHAFQAAEEKAKHLAFLKSAFLANMSHEIRTPMNGILGMAQLLENTPMDARQQQYIGVIRRSGDWMLRIVNDLLDLSKIEAGRVEIEKAAFDLTEIVDGVVALLLPQAQAKGIGLAAAYDSPPPRWYEGDAFRLRQVVLNIAGNAVKFTAAGRVEIRVRSEKAVQPAGGIAIEISDTGIGIPQAEFAKVFDKFHQVDASTTRRYGGTGLGLAISRELATLMGGVISLTSQVGVGSTVTILLPLKRASDPTPARTTGDLLAASQAQARPPDQAGAGRSILVAEDDPTNQIVIEGILKSKGFAVDIAATGLKVLELHAERAYDLILMDCHMPELDGYQTTKRIRAGEGLRRHIPIVALTASVLPQDRQRCLDAGMDDYLAKPVHMLTLWEMLQKWNCLTPLSPPVTEPQVQQAD